MGELAAVKIEEISPVKKKLSFEISWEEVKKGLDAMYRDVSRKARIPGFRQGKIPRDILVRHYKEKVEEETAAKLINDVYWDAVAKHDILVVSQPEIEQRGIVPESDFVFSATVEVEPLLEPKGYLELELEKEESAITEQDLEDRLKEIQNIFATLQDVEDDRALVSGGFASIDFQGMLAGEPLKELQAENYFIEVGSGTLVPGFEDQLVGMRKGEERQIEVSFPDDYQLKNLAGKEVIFNVKLKGIKEKITPEINEDFIKNFDRYDSLESLKAEIRENLKAEKQAKIEANLRKQIVDKILAIQENAFVVPPTFVERQVFAMMADMQQRLISRGMDKPKATEMAVKMHDSFRSEAGKIVLTALIIKNIGRIENITISESERQERIATMAAARGKTTAEVQASLEKDNMLESIDNEILHNKVFDFIISKAKIQMIVGEFPEIQEENP